MSGKSEYVVRGMGVVKMSISAKRGRKRDEYFQ